jgi:hypothetical protein
MAAAPDTIRVSMQSMVYAEGTEALTVAFAVISCAAIADNQIVAANATRKIRVLAYHLHSTSANILTWKSATTAKSGAMALPANGQLQPSYCPFGLFETAVNQALNLACSAATQVSGAITYVLV